MLQLNKKQQVRRNALNVPRIEARRVGDVGVVREVAGPAVDHAARVAAGAERQVAAGLGQHRCGLYPG